MVTPLIQRQNTNFRDCISPGERLMVTLRFLATGESFQSLSYMFRIGCSTIRKFVPDTCRAIHRVLAEKYFKCPNTTEEWMEVACGFDSAWQFPNCLGALDGKHVAIRPPSNSGAEFFNYKKYNSIVLMALVDSNYKFLYIDIGCNGRVSDGGVFRGCSLQESLEKKTVNIPRPAPLPRSDRMTPFCIVADEAFPLKPYLQKPYARRGLTTEQRIFNYRLSRARRVVENAFGILVNRWRVFLTTINLQPAIVEELVLACCALHNYLREECGELYHVPLIDREGPDHGFEPGTWRQDPSVSQAALPSSTNPTQQAKQTRETLTQYFNSEAGDVHWQWDKI
ncbi:hypothetical protein SKAU_G00248120 [Synaphobranchus kaupii]|uniref:DDE Tnp4 domain-containing protein n=1 Tax=Synaphobranchus kaupii TaxID=118154 RepID=A0A9Q1F2R1_SYNKA|nr:hypothetical protein SKAU_G00248120 [Synaphobranchus kaupii]